VNLNTQTNASKNRAPHLSTQLNVVEVENKKQIKTFIELPRKIYTDKNSRYVMPLEAHIKMMMGKVGTPQKHFFLAYNGTEPVARLGVKVHKAGKETKLHFGFFECDPKFPEAAKLLIDKAQSMYPALEMLGPFNFRQEDPYIGILVEGFEYDPFFMMTYNLPEYDSMLKDCGMEKAMDLFTYDMLKSNKLPELVEKNSLKARESLGLTFRQLDGKNLRKEARIISGIFNEALKDNWGFEEFLEDQINEMVLMFKFFIDPRVVVFALKDGVEIGCLIMIPNYNHLIKPSHGKLDFGLLSRYMKRKKTTDSFRGYALGVLKKYHGNGIGSALTHQMFIVCESLPYEVCEISWVLANNSPMNDLASAMGGKQNKVYRVYKKDALTGANSQSIN
jgi:hypothetical protein